VGEAPVPSSAAVFIKHQDGYNLETVQPLVRRLVTHSIPGLTPEKVSIVLVSAQAPRARTDPAAQAGRSRGEWGGLAVALGLVAAASLGGCGFLLWKYWWPQRGAGGLRSLFSSSP
jgi:type III secretion protein J